jgi:hypothetical protein
MKQDTLFTNKGADMITFNSTKIKYVCSQYLMGTNMFQHNSFPGQGIVLQCCPFIPNKFPFFLLNTQLGENKCDEHQFDR